MDIPGELTPFVGRPIGHVRLQVQKDFRHRIIPEVVAELPKQLASLAGENIELFTQTMCKGQEWSRLETQAHGPVLVWPLSVTTHVQPAVCPIGDYPPSRDVLKCLFLVAELKVAEAPEALLEQYSLALQ